MTTTIHPPVSTNGHDAAAPKPAEAQELRLQELERRGAQRDGWMLFMYVFSAMALLTAVFGAGLGVRAMQESRRNVRAAAAGGAAASVATTVHLSEFAIEPSVVNATAGGVLRIMNMGKTAHNLAVEGQNFRSAMIDPGSSGRLSLAGLAPGDYTVFCEVAGHREAGMKAQLHVKAAGGTPAASAAAAGGGAASGHTMSAEEMDAAMAASTKAFPAKTAGPRRARCWPRPCSPTAPRSSTSRPRS